MLTMKWLLFSRLRHRQDVHSVGRSPTSRSLGFEHLENRALLAGDVLSSATAVDVNNGQVDIVSEIGDELHGNLDVDLFAMQLTAGHRLEINANGPTIQQQFEEIEATLQSIRDANSGTKLADKIDSKVLKHIQHAFEQLDKTPPDLKKLAAEVKKSADGMNKLVKHDLLDPQVGADIMDSFVAVARQIAVERVEDAVAAGTKQKELDDAEKEIKKGDTERANGKLKKAVEKYEDLGRAKLNKTANGKGLGLKIALRVFDASGNEVAQEKDSTDLSLTYVAASTSTFYVGISDTQNASYDPNIFASGVLGGAGLYRAFFNVNEPPRIENFVAIEGHNNVWTFEGSVVDENPSAVIIAFGGILEGHSVQVNADGTFSFTITLLQVDKGLVTAQATDEYGLLSEIAEDLVQQQC